MQHYEIKITGSGTKEDLIKSLLSIADDLKNGEPCRYEDGTLYLDIDECEPFNED